MTKSKELRITEIECRADDNGEKLLEGYAVLWNSPTVIGGQFSEEFRQGAFTKALDTSDIRALADHDTSKVLGRTKSGTLQLEEDDKGLRVRITPPDTTTARDLMTLIERGDVSGMSFGFQAREQEWNHRSNPSTRIVKDAELFEVSVVTFPAYPDTSIALRSLQEDKALILKEKLMHKHNERNI